MATFTSLTRQLATALVLTLGGVLVHGWWQALAGVAPPAVEHWLHLLPGLAVRTLLPSAAGALVLAGAVLLAQHLALVGALAIGLAWLRRRGRPQSSSPASSPGNSTSVKPNWLKSRTRIG